MATSGSSSTTIAASRLTTIANVGGRDDVGVAGGTRGLDVAVDRVVLTDRGGELGDLRATDLVDG